LAYFQWDERLSVGHRGIDNDHQRLVQLIDQLHEAMSQGRGKAGLTKTLDELIAYTRDHFAREEAEMKRIGYAATDAHRAEHAKLVREVLALQSQLKEGGSVSALKVSGFLKNWLVNHIQTADKEFGAALNQSHLPKAS
jgi:hemerythrin-like metal-binding protein